jgi:succinate-semialdehyde dehydrogenase/glutarate-semialdehyde dehydrogenase
MAIKTTNPATGETLRTFEAFSGQEIETRIARAVAAYRSYRKTTFAQRANWMHAAAGILEAKAEDIAALMTLEMGKTLKAANAEVAKCAAGARFYAENAERFLADEPADPESVSAAKAYTHGQPLGRCWRSCRGTSRCGRSSGSPHLRSWQAMSAC